MLQSFQGKTWQYLSVLGSAEQTGPRRCQAYPMCGGLVWWFWAVLLFADLHHTLDWLVAKESLDGLADQGFSFTLFFLFFNLCRVGSKVTQKLKSSKDSALLHHFSIFWLATVWALIPSFAWAVTVVSWGGCRFILSLSYIQVVQLCWDLQDLNGSKCMKYTLLSTGKDVA